MSSRGAAADRDPLVPSNEGTIEAWNGVLFDRFLRFRDIVTTGLRAHGDHALRLHPPRPGDRALDVGCGFGDTTRRLAELVGPHGEAVGVDAAPRFIDGCSAGRASRLEESPRAILPLGHQRGHDRHRTRMRRSRLANANRQARKTPAGRVRASSALDPFGRAMRPAKGIRH